MNFEKKSIHVHATNSFYRPHAQDGNDDAFLSKSLSSSLPVLSTLRKETNRHLTTKHPNATNAQTMSILVLPIIGFYHYRVTCLPFGAVSFTASNGKVIDAFFGALQTGSW